MFCKWQNDQYSRWVNNGNSWDCCGSWFFSLLNRFGDLNTLCMRAREYVCVCIHLYPWSSLLSSPNSALQLQQKNYSAWERDASYAWPQFWMMHQTVVMPLFFRWISFLRSSPVNTAAHSLYWFLSLWTIRNAFAGQQKVCLSYAAICIDDFCRHKVSFVIAFSYIVFFKIDIGNDRTIKMIGRSVLFGVCVVCCYMAESV